MLTKKSRYKDAKPFTPPENVGTEAAQSADNSADIFFGIRAREITSATGVIEHEVRSGDRLDLLARHYYNDDRLWWRIVDANPEIVFAPEMLASEHEGTVILIPKIKE